MSVGIRWRTIANGKSLNGGSTFWAQLEELFGTGPIVLHESSVDQLRAFRVGLRDASEKKAVDDLIAALETHGEIEVFATY
jgi:hypothetical protein